MKHLLSILFFLLTAFNLIFAQSPGIGEGISNVGSLTSIITSIEELQEAPTEFILYPNFPNPFNPSTKIKYSLIEQVFVKLKLYDVTGREIKSLIEKEQGPGIYEVTLEVKNLSSGVYIYVLEAGDYKASQKMSYIK